MDNRLLKRFRREHRPKNNGRWVFHRAQWGDLEVSVMPRTEGGRVIDSNTGVVLKAPFHATLRGCAVVNDGSRPNCDQAALNYTLTGDRNKYWSLPGEHPWCIPRRRVTDSDRNDAYQGAVVAIMLGRKLTRGQAQGEADQLIWCADSISCGICKLLIPGLGAKELVSIAREYGWKVVLPFQSGSWRCKGCSYANAVEIPDDSEMAIICGSEWQ